MSRRATAEPQVEVILTASLGSLPFAITVWQFPSGNVQQVIYNKQAIAVLPDDVRKALETAFDTFDKLRGHRGEIVE